MVNGEKTILTNSAINAFKSCGRKYYWRYVREIEAKERPEALLLGTAIHGFLESHYCQLPLRSPKQPGAEEPGHPERGAGVLPDPVPG